MELAVLETGNSPFNERVSITRFSPVGGYRFFLKNFAFNIESRKEREKEREEVTFSGIQAYFHSNYNPIHLATVNPSKEYGKYINFGMTPRTQTCTRVLRARARVQVGRVCAGREYGESRRWLVVLDGDHDTVYSDG